MRQWEWKRKIMSSFYHEKSFYFADPQKGRRDPSPTQSYSYRDHRIFFLYPKSEFNQSLSLQDLINSSFYLLVEYTVSWHSTNVEFSTFWNIFVLSHLCLWKCQCPLSYSPCKYLSYQISPILTSTYYWCSSSTDRNVISIELTSQTTTV